MAFCQNSDTDFKVRTTFTYEWKLVLEGKSNSIKLNVKILSSVDFSQLAPYVIKRVQTGNGQKTGRDKLKLKEKSSCDWLCHRARHWD